MCISTKLLVLTGFVLISACANFSNLREDLSNLHEDVAQIKGSVSAVGYESDPIVIIYMKDQIGAKVEGYKVISTPGEFEIWVSRSPTAIFAYTDLNRDMIFQASEPSGWYGDGQLIDPPELGTRPLEIQIGLAAKTKVATPELIVNKPVTDIAIINNVNNGVIVTLAEPRFSQEDAESGLWQPYTFIGKGYAGIFFLEDYDPDRIPVLFVHGINGTPRSFESLIESLDKSRYQAWFFYYPSGLWLTTLSTGLFQMMEELKVRYQFEEAHVIAHSMGGLVSRGYINECLYRSVCKYLASFTSIATPWEGVVSANLGIRYAPTVVPVWNDLSPSSIYLKDLFIEEPYEDLRVNLLFAFKRDNLIGSENSDGAVSLSSQLRHDAQIQASKIMCFNKGHVGVLSDPLLLEAVNNILNPEGSTSDP